MDRYTRDKWLIHSNKHHKGNHSQNLKQSYKICKELVENAK